jgi:LmbE family N-acetylglucosaminyl deacetylase
MEMSQQRVLVIFAHPDDPEFMVGGTIARWAREGANITYVIITDGSGGSNDPTMERDSLISLRHREQRAACDTAGVKDLLFLGYQDGALQPTLELRRDLTRIIRRYRPTIVMCGDPTAWFYGGGYINHPDHRAAATAAIEAVFPSAETRPIFRELLDEGLEPHKVHQLWITGSSHNDMWVDISADIETKIEALRHHKSQVEVGDGGFIRKWAAEDGAKVGMQYAETFKVMKLHSEESTT